MSETPRTQQLIDIANDEGISDAAVALVLQEHSEQLERELAEARAEIERKDVLIEQMREALRLALPEARSTHCEQTILAALAAERHSK